jgi:hypothetical protein
MTRFQMEIKIDRVNYLVVLKEFDTKIFEEYEKNLVGEYPTKDQLVKFIKDVLYDTKKEE